RSPAKSLHCDPEESVQRVEERDKWSTIPRETRGKGRANPTLTLVGVLHLRCVELSRLIPHNKQADLRRVVFVFDLLSISE
ncbi:hypothetical protein EUTSA_v10022245mg, partial [Eutrema salsugineum]